MAIFPCSFRTHRYRGKAAHAYPALIRPSGREDRRHSRLCAAHMAELEELAGPYLAADAAGEVEPSPRATLCMGCSRFVDEVFTQFFMTTFPGGDERRDYWGILHPACRAPAWLEGLLGVSPSARPGDGVGHLPQEST